MKLDYTIWDPTKNITLLVSTPVPRMEQAGIAAKLMSERPRVEQVGFLEDAVLPGAVLRLQMMGGEFCGNASMSAAAYAARQDGLSSLDIPLEVSGYSGLLRCRLDRRDDGLWGTVNMPLPARISTAALPGVGDVPAVVFDGITHCIVPASAVTREAAEAAIGPLCAALGTDACGILLCDESAAAFAPLVYVRSTGTAVWESGCGSGSAAVGAYLASRRDASKTTGLRQPGGTITVFAEWKNGHVSALTITGHVALLEQGSCEV
jgi:diaminopimelate epimerase